MGADAMLFFLFFIEGISVVLKNSRSGKKLRFKVLLVSGLFFCFNDKHWQGVNLK